MLPQSGKWVFNENSGSIKIISLRELWTDEPLQRVDCSFLKYIDLGSRIRI